MWSICPQKQLVIPCEIYFGAGNANDEVENGGRVLNPIDQAGRQETLYVQSRPAGYSYIKWNGRGDEYLYRLSGQSIKHSVGSPLEQGSCCLVCMFSGSYWRLV